MPLNILAWNNKIGPWYYFVGLRTKVMINRDSWGYSYSIVRGGKYTHHFDRGLFFLAIFWFSETNEALTHIVLPSQPEFISYRNSWISGRRTTAKAFIKDVFINQERKLGDRRWLDTIVVLTINYADKGLAEFRFVSVSTLWEITSFWVPGGVWSQGWNLKKLTEGHHQEWSLRLNLTQHGKTYQVSNQLAFEVTPQCNTFQPMNNPLTTYPLLFIFFFSIATGPDIVRIDRLRALSWFYGWWCMDVLSWWSDLSG